MMRFGSVLWRAHHSQHLRASSATAAYEHELDAIPNKVANVRLRGELPPRRRTIDLWDAAACTAPESAKPRIKGQKTSQPILKASLSAAVAPSISCWVSM